MVKFVARACCFLLLQFAIGIVILSPHYWQRPPDYLAAMEDKISLLKEPGDERLIFVGGSTTAFGIDSTIFEQHVGRKTINVGLHAGLGLDIYLRILEDHVREGDIVVLIPEWPMIRGKLQMEPRIARALLRAHPGSLQYMGGNLPAVKEIADRMALAELAHWTQQGTGALCRSCGHPGWFEGRRYVKDNAITRVYRRDNFNQSGDMIGHHGMPAMESDIALHFTNWKKKNIDKRGGKWIREFPDGLTWQAQTDKSIARINRFVDYCQQRGARVFLSYPTRTRQFYELYAESIEATRRYFESGVNAPVLTNPADSVFPTDYFFDNVGHLNEAGKNARSRMLLVGLSRELVRVAINPGKTRFR